MAGGVVGGRRAGCVDEEVGTLEVDRNVYCAAASNRVLNSGTIAKVNEAMG